MSHSAKPKLIIWRISKRCLGVSFRLLFLVFHFSLLIARFSFSLTLIVCRLTMRIHRTEARSAKLIQSTTIGVVCPGHLYFFSFHHWLEQPGKKWRSIVQSIGRAQMGTRCKLRTMRSGVCAFLQPLAFEFLLLTRFRRHREYCGGAPKCTKLYNALLNMMHIASNCAVFECPLVLSGRSPYSISINRRDSSKSEYSPNNNAEVWILSASTLTM